MSPMTPKNDIGLRRASHRPNALGVEQDAMDRRRSHRNWSKNELLGEPKDEDTLTRNGNRKSFKKKKLALMLLFHQMLQ